MGTVFIVASVITAICGVISVFCWLDVWRSRRELNFSVNNLKKLLERYAQSS